jgi:MFS family permease
MSGVSSNFEDAWICLTPMQKYSGLQAPKDSPRQAFSRACQLPWRRLASSPCSTQTHRAYWLAGTVSAVYALANALISPQISRTVDRLGQTRVLLPTTAIAIAAFALLVLAANRSWPV